jgi:hypothetical protein
LQNPTEDLAKHIIEAEPIYDNRGKVTIAKEEWDEILELALEAEHGNNL